MNIKDDLVRHFRWLRRYGHNDSHSGNASVRAGDVVWITPADCCADALSSGDLVECRLDGSVGRAASPEAPIHLAIYRANPLIRAVLQSHGPYSIAMTLDNEEFAPSASHDRLQFDRVPVLTIPYDGYAEQAPELLARVLAEYPIAVVRGHGIYACAESLDLAYRWTCALELSAKTAFIARQAGKL
ncbi:MAG TPA: class II aldolase/adducin family protein [Candidatus Competibacteraceae bacterium]|nr:class II aldolase/adducin family protein [Candidatus Competibacteraceae bacterium]